MGELEDPQHGTPLAQQRDQRSEQRPTTGERLRPVDRIEDPHMSRLGVLRTFLLPHDSMTRVRARELLAEDALHGPVGFGDRRPIPLELPAERGVPVLETSSEFRARQIGEAFGKGSLGLIL